MDRAQTTSLLAEARAGSREALDTLFRQICGRLLTLIRARMGGDDRADRESRDVLQITLLRGFERLDQFAGGEGASLMAWLARIAENEIRDRRDYRHRARRDAAREVPLSNAGGILADRVRSALSQVALGEQVDRLARALDRLDPTYREVVLLRKIEELSYKEIAARMGRSEDACRMLLARAMAALTLQVAALR